MNREDRQAIKDIKSGNYASVIEYAKKKTKRRILAVCGIILALIVFVFMVFMLNDLEYESDILTRKYNSVGQVKQRGSGDGSKKLNFLTSYYSETGDLTLATAVKKNKGEDGMSESGGSSTGDNETDDDNKESDSSDGRIPDLTGTNYTKEQVLKDISDGKYSKEDVDYITALTKEAGGYRGNLAVAAVVINRSKLGNASIKSVVTAPGQFEGYDYSAVGNWTEDIDLFNASIALLRGDEQSPVGTARYFFGRVNGYDLWAETGSGRVTNLGNNIFYEVYGKVHNKKGNKTPSNGHCIYDYVSRTWYLKDGEYKNY